ncbi:MAG: SDR family NAD(P)-dependent oxidoreductase [Acidimicrobiales bacterium]
MPQSAVLVGGTSDIGLAIVEALATRRLERVVLAGRNLESLEGARSRLGGGELAEVHVEVCDVTSASDIEALTVRSTELLGTVDLVIIAAGELGTAELGELGAERVLTMMATNAGGPAAAAISFTSLMRQQGYGRLVVLSSVAGLRVRRANFVYGAGKAALDGFALGLADAARDEGVLVTIVRPGFVRTRMTAGMRAAPFSVDVGDVADAVLVALGRGSEVVYVPAILRSVFAVLRLLPRAVFRRLPG